MDDFCLTHGRDHMRCEKAWGAIPYCAACEPEESDRDEVQRLRAAMEAARSLIGAINDNASAAVKASNINRAWHILDDALRTPALTQPQTQAEP